MERFSYGDLSLIELGLITLNRGTDPSSELGKQLCECIGKVDSMLLEIRTSADLNADKN